MELIGTKYLQVFNNESYFRVISEFGLNICITVAILQVIRTVAVISGLMPKNRLVHGGSDVPAEMDSTLDDPQGWPEGITGRCLICNFMNFMFKGKKKTYHARTLTYQPPQVHAC